MILSYEQFPFQYLCKSAALGANIPLSLATLFLFVDKAFGYTRGDTQRVFKAREVSKKYTSFQCLV
jgi:hypothetical protein